MNALQELITELEKLGKTTDNIVTIRILYHKRYLYYEKSLEYNITSLEDLNFEYNDGYGGQELYGYILLDYNDWLERHEYDGSEWWEYKKYPKWLLEELK